MTKQKKTDAKDEARRISTRKTFAGLLRSLRRLPVGTIIDAESYCGGRGWGNLMHLFKYHDYMKTRWTYEFCGEFKDNIIATKIR